MEGIQAERLISTVDNISSYLSAIAGELEKQNAILAKNHEINKRQLELQEIYLEQKKDVRQGWVDTLNENIEALEKSKTPWTDALRNQLGTQSALDKAINAPLDTPDGPPDWDSEEE